MFTACVAVLWAGAFYKSGLPPSGTISESLKNSQSNVEYQTQRDGAEIKRPACDRNDELVADGSCLPSYMVIGTQKSATVALFNLMRQHPNVLVPKNNHRELGFFSPKVKGGAS